MTIMAEQRRAEFERKERRWRRRIKELEAAIYWALGENGEFNDGPQPLLAGKYRRPYWWRTELRARAKLGLKSNPGEKHGS